MSLAAVALEVSEGDRGVLERLARSGSVSARSSRQARVLLLASDGVANEEIARRCGVAPNTVRAWRRGFDVGGVGWLGTAVGGRGPARSLDAGRVSAIVADTLFEEPPDGSACWSTRLMGERHGVGKDIVARVWREHGLRPWRQDVYKLSRDPDFEAELVDVVGLYLDPPEAAAVFAFDEKTQVQALDQFA
ncbi:MAG: helix-turn-helix domain-containing protein [Acidimicrobiaceae bacterium]|nr:helix-turn-helix domain-containing protein [Acidimicrobiaceae bacterium]